MFLATSSLPLHKFFVSFLFSPWWNSFSNESLKRIRERLCQVKYNKIMHCTHTYIHIHSGEWHKLFCYSFISFVLQSVPVSFIHYLNRSSLNSMDSLAITSFIFLAAFLLFFLFFHLLSHSHLPFSLSLLFFLSFYFSFHSWVVKYSMSWPSNVCWPGDWRKKLLIHCTLHIVF